MAVDMQKLMQNKEVIINSIRNRGPSLPVQIAKDASLSLLFASAYLSELYNERKIKMSSMKVGSSPLYYLEGQEAQLENFVQYLNTREKEAFNQIKAEKLVNDEKLEPAIRVAIRGIKDFAIPIRVNIDNNSKLFWKHFLISDDETKTLAQEMMLGKKKEKKVQEEVDKQETLVRKQEVEKAPSKKETEEKEDRIDKLSKKIDEISSSLNKPLLVVEKPKKEKKIKLIEESKFVKNVKEYLISKDIELLESKDEKKKDFLAKVRIDSAFGKQEYLLIAKEKKKITEEDITLALHRAQEEKLPAVLLSSGDIDKRAQEHAKTWKNLVKFEKVKF